MPNFLCLFFRQCSCGIDYRITNRPDGKAQTIQCQCKQKINIFGTILDAYFALHGSCYLDWIEIAWEPLFAAPKTPWAMAAS